MSAGDQRRERVTVRFTAAELKILESDAASTATSVSELVRLRALRVRSTRPTPSKQRLLATSAVVSELNGIGVRLRKLPVQQELAPDQDEVSRLSEDLSRVLKIIVMGRP